uniref:Reverse transcriptase domain-containing protein n=1 Tax=Tanacetum cinerariifolium TaxID=118510 RepID=A0A6L2JI53_TANCI|nr:hypothetical protein [Tanacetum cinerariifolium]
MENENLSALLEGTINLATRAIKTTLSSPLKQCGASAIQHHPVGAKWMLFPRTLVQGSRPTSREEENNAEDNTMSDDSIEKHDGSDAVVPLKENEDENKTKYEPVKRIAEDVLVDVVGYVYPVDFMILDIKEEKRPFILGTPFLTTTKFVIKFDKGTITLKAEKSKISFHTILETLCRIEKGTKNEIELIATTMTVNRLVLEWEERIRLHQEKKIKFDQQRSKTFGNERPAPVKEECEVMDEGGVM